jgi:hypothetical protein
MDEEDQDQDPLSLAVTPTSNGPISKEQRGRKRKLSPQEKVLEQETAEHKKRMELIELQIRNEGRQHEARMNNLMLERDLINHRLQNS